MKYGAAALAIAFLFQLAGCGGGNSNSSTPVTVSPASVTLAPGKTQQFTATVTGTTNSAVTWEVNGTAGGSAATGTISTTGFYAAPSTVTAVTITAVSVADPTKSGNASVSIAAPISISPLTTAINLGGTVQFTATVTFSTNTAVTWQVNGVTGGNSTLGTISTSGLYTSPASAITPDVVTITAVSQADATQSASATLTVNPPPLVITPTGVTLTAGGQQSFTAAVNGTNVTPTWTLTCGAQSNAACGTLTTAGLYTAPLVPPPGGSATLTATMPDGSAVSASTNVLIQFSNGSLSGQYAYSFTVRDNQELSAEAGSLTFDGNGSITGGVLDRSMATATPITITGGTYQIGVDGRGTAVLQTSAGIVSWQLVITDQPVEVAVRIDSNGAIATGTLVRQNASKIGLGFISGGYALRAAGLTGTTTQLAMAGSVTVDGAGNISRGIFDISSGSGVTTNAAASGTFGGPAASGRGTLTVSSTFGPQTFAFYQVDDTRLMLVEIDGANVLAGELLKQAGGPFSTSTFNGRYGFTLAGMQGSSSIGIGGLFTMNGGNITNRIVDGANQTVFDSGGSYAVTDASSGRTTVTWTVNNGRISQYVVYPRSDGGFVMLQVDGNGVGEGIVLPQTLSNPSVFSLTGNFALSLEGNEPPTGNGGESISGQLVFGGGKPFTGTLDIDKNGAVTEGGAFQVGIFTVDTGSGRGVATADPNSAVLNNANLILYVLDANHALMMENDSVRIVTGVVTRQY